jgi:hypothetical protein
MSTKAGPEIVTYQYTLQSTGNGANGAIVSWRNADGSLFEKELSYTITKTGGIGTTIVILCARYGTFNVRFKGNREGSLLLATGEDIPVPIIADEGPYLSNVTPEGISLINNSTCLTHIGF